MQLAIKHTRAHAQMLTPTVRLQKSNLFFLSFPFYTAWNTGTDKAHWIGYSSHLSCHGLSSSRAPTPTMSQRARRFKAGLPHCQLLWDYNIGDDWTVADRRLKDAHEHTHRNNNTGAAGEATNMLTGITVIGDNIKEAGSCLRLHVAWIVMRLQYVPDI